MKKKKKKDKWVHDFTKNKRVISFQEASLIDAANSLMVHMVRENEGIPMQVIADYSLAMDSFIIYDSQGREIARSTAEELENGQMET